MPSRSLTSPSCPSVSNPTRTRSETPTRLGPDFMKYPHPDAKRVLAHLENLSCVTDETKRCITNLLNHRAVRMRARLPRKQSSAVLVALFIGRSGELYVVLSRRSDTLRAFAGDTALPGGKMDVQDMTIEDTARREAFEEIGLPQDKERLPLLCVMEPLLARGEMLVTPVIVLITDYNLQPHLNSSEVVSIFAQPLVSFLSSKPHPSSGHTDDSKNPFYTFTDIPSSEGTTYRLHSFRTGREAEGVKPVIGLTALILINTASIGYGRIPDFEVRPYETHTLAERIAYALLTTSNPLRNACQQEGIDVTRTIARLMRPPVGSNATRVIEWVKIGMLWKKLMEGGQASATVSTQGGDCQGKDPQNVIFHMATLGEFLDELRDAVNDWIEELKGDEKKLSTAREVYPKVMEEVKKTIEEARSKGGEFDLQTLFGFISEEGQGNSEGGSGWRVGDGDDPKHPIAPRCGTKL